MTGHTLRQARERAGWPQVRLATSLGVTQAYLSLMESGKRRIPDRLARAATRVLRLPATELPVAVSRQSGAPSMNAKLADELARFEYPGFAYRRKRGATQNPAEVLLNALTLHDLDVRVAEALPWLFLRFDEMDSDLVLGRAKAHDLQNRLGFTVALAREVAENDPAYGHRAGELRALERRLENSRLAREDTFGQREMSERMRAWLRDNRSDAAKHWNLLTDLRTEHLPYAGHDSEAVAEFPS